MSMTRITVSAAAMALACAPLAVPPTVFASETPTGAETTVVSQATHVIRFSLNGGQGNVPETQALSGEPVNLPKTDSMTRTGFAFTGWNTQADGKGTQYNAGSAITMGDTDITLYAQWQGDQTQISYEPNGGQGSMPDTAGLTGDIATLSKNGYMKDGSSFIGWNTQPNGKGATYADGAQVQIPTGGLTLYAQWNDSHSGISYNANDGKGSMPSAAGEPGSLIDLPDSGFSRTGYTFAGWNTAADGSGQQYRQGDPITIPETPFTLYAQWDANQASLSFDLNGGANTAIPPVDGVTDQTVQLSELTPERAGYRFTGWTSDRNGKEPIYQPGDQFTMFAEQTLYAQWTPISFTVSYDSNDGRGAMLNQRFTFGEPQSLYKASFAREGYVFDHWNTSKDGSGATYTDRQSVQDLTDQDGEAITLYAQWKTEPRLDIQNEPAAPGNLAQTGLHAGVFLPVAGALVILASILAFLGTKPNHLSNKRLPKSKTGQRRISEPITREAGTVPTSRPTTHE